MAAKPATPLEVRHIRYIKPDETEASDRFIITAHKPPPTVMLALDVTELSEAERETMAKAYTDYLAAFEAYSKAFPKFAHELEVKWRSFTLNRIMEPADAKPV